MATQPTPPMRFQTTTKTEKTGIALASSGMAERTLQQLAVETVIWGMPAVNYDLMIQAIFRGTKGAVNHIIYWSRLLHWRDQGLTSNPDAIYFMPFINTQDVGPVVLDIPPADEGSLNGNVFDAWQAPLGDLGAAGVDNGRGGKYLILPPGYKCRVPDDYIVLPSETYGVFAVLRSTLRSGSEADVVRAVAYGKRVKLYPLAQEANSLPTTFDDAIDVVFDATTPYDLRFFQSLDHIVQSEPWRERDKALIDPLKTIGIEKGKPFKPDAKTEQILKSSALEARAWIEASYTTFFPPLYANNPRLVPPLPDVIERQATSLAHSHNFTTDARGPTYPVGFIGVEHLAVGQFYLTTIKGSFDGGMSYRLKVPANGASRYHWSATAFDSASHTRIRNMPWSIRSSESPGIKKNADGSVDVYFGPKAPAGKESNWIPTSTGGKFEVLFRLYGPEKPLLDKTLQVPDIEKTNLCD